MSKLVELYEQWQSVQPLPTENHQALWQWIRIKFNHHSNHFEGNTLNYSETQLLLIHGQTAGDHTMREYEEMKAHNVAFKYICDLAKKEKLITEGDIRDLNKILLKEPFYKTAVTPDGQKTRKQIIPGQYKKQPNHVITKTGEIFQFASPEETPAKMQELTTWIQNWLSQDTKDKNLISFLAELHQKFIIIHPFDDGNGRVVRLLLAYTLMRLKFLPMVLENRDTYIKAIRKADAGDISHLENLFLEHIALMLKYGIYSKNNKVKLDQKVVDSNFPENNKIHKDKTAQSIKRPSFREDESSQVPALQLLQNLGWIYLTPEEALNYRKNNVKNVLLEDILEKQLRKINQIKYKDSVYQFKDVNISNAIHELKTMPFEGLIKTSEKVFELITLGKSYRENIQGDRKSYNLKYIDWENPTNNVYHVTDEYNVETLKSDESRRRPDIVLFINGIPVVIIECKRPGITDPIEEAVSQHIRNQKSDEIPHLFIFAQILTAICPSNTQINKNQCLYGTAGTARSFWYPWKEPKDSYEEHLVKLINTPLSQEKKDNLFGNERYKNLRAYFEELEKSPRQITSQDIMLYGLCRPQRVIEFIRKFTLYDAGTKKTARYQQYFSVKDTLKRITSAEPNQKRPDGVIWHTQGSGKSLSMVLLAKSIAMEPKIPQPKIILVTDRIDLDRQIYKTFQNCQTDLTQAKNSQHLIELLQSHKAEIIASTIFKFSPAAYSKGVVLDSNDIIVLVDEAHRTQYGELQAKMRKVFPNACFIAYTGTPLTKKEKHTMQKFGEIISTYTSRQALEDKAIIPLLYEGRIAEQNITKNILDRMFERITKNLTKEQKADLKQKYNRSNALAKTEQRMRMIAMDISEHFSKMWKGKGFKGQLAVTSIATAFKYKKYFDELGEISAEVVVSPIDDRQDHKDIQEDETAWQKHERMVKENFGTHKNYEKEIIGKFNTKEDPDILIVVNKLLTGFDVPRNTVLYIDKNLEGHTLLQAVARVNRVFEHKKFGYIIDYHGNLKSFLSSKAHYEKLAEATQQFDEFDRKEIQDSIRNIKEETEKLPEYYSNLKSLFKNVANKLDVSAYEQVLLEEEKREDFYKRFSQFGNSLHLALSSSEFITNTSEKKIKEYKSELKFFCKLKNHIQKVYAESIDYKDYEPKIENILNNYVQAEEVKTVVPLVEIYDNKFHKELKNYKGDKSKALTIMHRTKKYISDNMAKDRNFYEKLSNILQEVLNGYREGRFSEADLLKKAQNIQNQALTRRDDSLPPSLEGQESAKAFFGILQKVFEKNNKLSKRHINHLADMSIAVSQIIKDNIIVDWARNTDVQNKMKNKIEDYLYEQKDKLGVFVDFDSIDQILEETIKTAKSHF